MKKAACFLFVFLVSLNFVLAESVSGTYGVGEKVTVGGYVITIDRISDEEAIVLVDGRSVFVEKDQEEYQYGVNIKMSNPRISKTRKNTADFFITTYATCGDGTCDPKYENTQICCRDCGCRNNEYACADNYCLDPKTSECIYDKDCKDEHPEWKCVGKKCSGTPRRCSYWEVTESGISDGCCLPETLAKDDPDCYQCSEDEDCKEKIACGKMSCADRACVPRARGCPLENGSCITIEERHEENYCEEDGKWKSQKKIGEACSHTYECVLEARCLNDVCTEKEELIKKKRTEEQGKTETKIGVKEEIKENVSEIPGEKQNIFVRFWSWLKGLFASETEETTNSNPFS